MILSQVMNLSIKASKSLTQFSSQTLVLLFFPFDVMTQRTLSHGLPLLSRGHPPPLHQPHFLPLMRTHPPSPLKNYSPTPLPPLLNTPLPSSPSHHSPPLHHAHSPYHPKENHNDVYDVSEIMIKLAQIDAYINMSRCRQTITSRTTCLTTTRVMSIITRRARPSKRRRVSTPSSFRTAELRYILL